MWLSRCPNILLLSCSSKSSWTAFRTAKSSRWLMCSYDSTCDQPATGRSVSVHHFTDSLASLYSTKTDVPIPFVTCIWRALKGTKMYSTQVHTCLEMFDLSSEGDSIDILIDKNLVILSNGSITRNSFESHCRHKYSNFCLGCRWHFFKFRRNPAWSKMSKTILVWEINCLQFRAKNGKLSKWAINRIPFALNIATTGRLIVVKVRGAELNGSQWNWKLLPCHQNPMNLLWPSQ